MKDYLNHFHGMIDNLHNWNDSTQKLKKDLFLLIIIFYRKDLLSSFIEESKDTTFFVYYFDKFSENLLNNTLNFYIKGVIKT